MQPERRRCSSATARVPVPAPGGA
ncbi:hypothetical protein AOLI_G00260060 [Acnodon oligacanthus]